MPRLFRRGRPPYPEILTPSEQRVLELIKQRKTNSEIANELAISVPGVKYHVSNMLGKLGVADRGRLAEWDAHGQHLDRRLQLIPAIKLAAALFGASSVVVGVVAVRGLLSDGAAEPALVADALQATPYPIPGGYQAVDPATLEALGLVDAGPLLKARDGGNPVVAGDLRDSLSIVLVHGTVEVLTGPGEPWSISGGAVVPNAIFLTGRFNGINFSVNLWAEDRAISKTTQVTIEADGVRRIASQAPDEAPVVLLSAWRALDGVKYRAAIADNGHLYMSSDAIDSAAVLDEWTGEELDVSAAFRAEPLPPLGTGAFRFTGCGEASPCYVSFRSVRELTAPFAGTLRCVTPDRIEIDHGDFIVRIARVDTGFGAFANFSCDPHAVAAGEVVGPAGRHWVYDAVDSKGEHVSIGVSGDGDLYIGTFRPTVGCPCQSGT